MYDCKSVCWQFNNLTHCVNRDAAARDLRSRDPDVHRTEEQQEVESAVRAEPSSQICHPAPPYYGSH